MIPQQSIVAWSNAVPWVDARQVEHDLILSRALVEIFSDPSLCSWLRVRGGTALHKLHLPRPLRFSEDIDLVRTEAGPIGPILSALRQSLESWLGSARFTQSAVAPKLIFRVESSTANSAPIRLKIEINTREIHAFDPPKTISLSVSNPWFTGRSEIATFSTEEILATKTRALLQRNKGRDLFDVAYTLHELRELDLGRAIEIFGNYLAADGLTLSRAQAQQRMFRKLSNESAWDDIRPSLPAEIALQHTQNSQIEMFRSVFVELIDRFPGQPWARTPEYLERFKINL